MKKIVMTIFMIMTLIYGTLSFATNDIPQNDVNIGKDAITDSNEEITQATEKILDNMSKKEKKIAEYTDKYNNVSYAYTAYYLDMVQIYSIPICIIGITIGAFNYYIIGEKKLDKKEQGFGLIMAFLCALVLFQVLPLIFALLVAGK